MADDATGDCPEMCWQFRHMGWCPHPSTPEHVDPDLPVEQWWLSFCDPHLPEGSQFLGVAIVDAIAGLPAVMKTHELGINPGGEVKFVGPLPAGSIGVEWCNRLLTREEAESVPAPEWAAQDGV